MALKDFIPLGVAALTILLGFITNSLLEWSRRSAAERRLARAIRRILCEELKAHRRGIREMMAAARSADPSVGPTLHFSIEHPAFDHHLKDVGLLEHEEIDAVVRAYGELGRLPQQLAALGTVSKGELFLTAALPESRREAVLRIGQRLLTNLTIAVRTTEWVKRRTFWQRQLARWSLAPKRPTGDERRALADED
jgi:hypothetical protein